MICEVVTFPDGNRAFVCGSRRKRRKCACGKPATKLCDHPQNVLGDTCDRPICDDCAVSIGENRDLCPRCAAPVPKQGQLTLEGL